jgi:2-oxoglutarate/2-oxoacid ferredoxin oxidoreductase subunit beta
MVSTKDFDTHYEITWCPGCGNFGILAAMKQALAKQGIAPHEVLIISGIGQAAKTPESMKCSMVHALHGRALPLATGAKIANHNLRILVNTGDGDCYGEGGNHFMHAVRRNIDLTVLAHNNMVFGLTKGQASPTSARGTVTRFQSHGVIMEPFNPLMVALALRAGFVARGFSGNIEHLSMLIQEAMAHRGFSLIDILQPCVSFNTINTHKWYSGRVYDVAKEDHDPTDYDAALRKAREWGDRIPLGIIYREERPTYTDELDGLREGPLIDRNYSPEPLRRVLSEL